MLGKEIMVVLEKVVIPSGRILKLSMVNISLAVNLSAVSPYNYHCNLSPFSLPKEFYVETICDGEPARTVKCPQQNVISTVWASYGRQHPDMCVDDNQMINTTCKADYDTVLSMVQESCDDSNSCSLESNKDEYGDPPECQGVKKYLQMYYLCKSGEMCS